MGGEGGVEGGQMMVVPLQGFGFYLEGNGGLSIEMFMLLSIVVMFVF